MAYPILMPRPGQMTEECTVVAWHKLEGDLVRKGDVLFEIETDKSTMEVEAFDEGVLLRIVADAGETMPVNTVCGWVGQPGEPIPDATAAPPQIPTSVPAPVPDEPSGPAPAASRPAASGAPGRGGVPQPAALAPGGDRPGSPISPRAAGLAAAHANDPRMIVGTGPGGRIIERDVLALLATEPPSAGDTPTARRAVAASVEVTPDARASAPKQPTGPALIEPEAVALAAQEFVAAAGIRGTGPAGQVTRADVEHARRDLPQPLSRMRQVIAQRLTESYTTTPHFAVTVSVDMTELLQLREELRARPPAYSVTDFISAAVIAALVEFPVVNGHTNGEVVWPRQHVDLGLAVALESGLVVPVIREAELMQLPELHQRAEALVAAARAGTLPPEALSGSSFTISNMGMLGVEHFTAIINPGEAAILAVSSTIPSPAVVDGRIGIRQIMRLTLSADHRLVDGALAARFLNAVRRRLEDVAALRPAVAPPSGTAADPPPIAAS
jgi:pyruvate dehydrogenase E2 component (dihydrolipoamide acetyltransferase)